MEEINHIQAVFSMGLSAAEVRRPVENGERDTAGAPFVVVPDGAALKNIENLLLNPVRKTGAIKLGDAQSFCDMVRQEAQPETRIYCTMQPPRFVAVINDHGDTPGWRDYTLSYDCPLSVEWKTWAGANGKQMTQADFAKFVEDNLPDIATPPAADMLEIARSLEAKKKVNFASGIRLSNGQNELTYEEEISGTAAKGKLQVPEIFTIGVPVLEGGQRYAVDARLRYRIADGGKLTIWYDLVRPHKIVEDAAKDVRAFIAANVETTRLVTTA